jgi:tRNA pseudouridine-54 N-methylase
LHVAFWTYKSRVNIVMWKLDWHPPLLYFQVVCTPGKDTEIEIIINFLSHKLVAKSCALRHRSRCCLTSLFQTNPRHTDVQVSLPSSPREMKRTESTPGGTSRWQGPTLDTTNAISHHPKKAMAGASGSSSAHVSPGISPGFPVAVSNLEKTKVVTQGSVLEDDTSWLKLLETLPTASRLISAFLPAIRLAMQQETSISVVRIQTLSKNSCDSLTKNVEDCV